MDTQGAAPEVVDVDENAEQEELYAGRRVILRNLVAIPELNGEEGHCGEVRWSWRASSDFLPRKRTEALLVLPWQFDTLRQRHPVTLDNGRVVAVKVDNLELVPNRISRRDNANRSRGRNNPIVISDDEQDAVGAQIDDFPLPRAQRSRSREEDVLDNIAATARPSRQERRAAQRRERRLNDQRRQWMDLGDEGYDDMPRRTGGLGGQTPEELDVSVAFCSSSLRS